MSRYASGLPWCCDPGLGHTQTHIHTLCKRMHAYLHEEMYATFFFFFHLFANLFSAISAFTHVKLSMYVCVGVCV